MSPDWVAGFCAAWSLASQTSIQQIDHYKALVGEPGKTITGDTIKIMLSGIDSYVRLMPLPPGRSLLINGIKGIPDGTQFTCPEENK